MPAVFDAGVLADPVGLMVGLIEAREPGLDRGMITAIVEQLAGGPNAAAWPRPCWSGPACWTTAGLRHRGRSVIC